MNPYKLKYFSTELNTFGSFLNEEKSIIINLDYISSISDIIKSEWIVDENIDPMYSLVKMNNGDVIH